MEVMNGMNANLCTFGASLPLIPDLNRFDYSMNFVD
jgi:hypothetical protein